MHGRLKVRTTEEQKLIKEKKQQEKLKAYRQGFQQILSTRHEVPYNQTSFAICSQLLIANPDISTLWNYRKEVILQEIETSDKSNEEELGKFMTSEIKLTEQCLLANPKSYGSWYHRFWVLDRHPKPDWNGEFALCSLYLMKDDRNFHCWDYRRLILEKIGIDLDAERKFSTERININFSNYSSWHYRSTLKQLNQESLDEEINLVQNAVFTDPADSSAWFYLRWILSSQDVTKKHKEDMLCKLESLQELDPDCKWIYIAKSWLTKGVRDGNSVAADGDCFRTLIQIDPLRKGHYNDCLNNID
ncbi:PREDICTED: geranylgeranyl transferase type-2 subunit alpha [Nicrophorus vespilloides]|uniref:Geranylgeranyl transferase type-2 subunit alpha n=1 Tax=Nicrophorus vespilloides TaxID=110193 RepID=A0ABM1ML03_NICVS|nr:PREDICTED: geranylgeranyl transferase type-2 subunit alpha [Nicrophorus vespilloides]